MDKYLVVVAGPTGIGKTDLSIAVAQHFDTEIISADSRQIYKELNIGVAKPADCQLKQVKHHFISFLHIDEEYNAGKFEVEALSCLDDIFKRKNLAFLVGGSGLYIRAVCHGLDNFPSTDPKVRTQLMEAYEKQGIEFLQQELKNRDPLYYNKVDTKNPRRLVRALEVCINTGMPYSSFHSEGPKKRKFNIIKIGLTMDRKELYQRINNRVDSMIESGLLEETKALKINQSRNALQTVGYQELFDYLDGKTDFETAVELIKQHSRIYAKRQLTWFGKEKDMHWFRTDQLTEIIGYIKQFVKAV